LRPLWWSKRRPPQVQYVDGLAELVELFIVVAASEMVRRDFLTAPMPLKQAAVDVIQQWLRENT